MTLLDDTEDFLQSAGESILAYFATPGPGRYHPGDTILHHLWGYWIMFTRHTGPEGHWRVVAQWRDQQ